MSEWSPESPRQLTALLICPDPNLSRQFQNACASLDGFTVALEFNDYPTPAQLSDRIAQSQVNAVLLDVGSNRDTALNLASLFLDHWPSVTAVGLHQSNDPDAILQCMRGGCTEFLCSPFPAGDLAQAAKRILRRKAVETRPEQPSKGRLLAFAPVKGGSGASTISANIAYQIHRASMGRVLLADFNIAAGITSFLLRITHQYSVLDALRHAGEIDAALWSSLVVQRDGIDLLLAPERPEPAIIEPQPVQAVLEHARAIYDYVVVDLGSVCGSMSMATLSVSDSIYLVCSSDLASLFMMRRTIPLIEELGYTRDHIKILVNRVGARAEVSLSDMEKIFRASVHATFPPDTSAVQKALREGVPLAENCELSKSLCNFVKETLGNESRVAPRTFGVRALKELLGGT